MPVGENIFILSLCIAAVKGIYACLQNRGAAHGKQSFVIIALSGIMGKRKTEGGAGEERRGAECGKKRTEKQKNIKIKRKNL